MSLKSEQAKLTEGARLLLASPDEVFKELEKTSRQIIESRDRWAIRQEKLEPMLVKRGERLINLALACYGADEEVFKALYKYGKEPAQNEDDLEYKRGLRLGCLSNQTIGIANASWQYPAKLIGEHEVQRVLAEGEWEEVDALLCNPEFSDTLLEHLFSRGEEFAALPEDRWRRLVAIGSKNARINRNFDSDEEPDLNHYRIRKLIAQLFGKVPVNEDWIWTLHGLLLRLSPARGGSMEEFEATFTRWKSVEVNNYKNEPRRGQYLDGITFVDEFRCLMAAIYGGLKKNTDRADLLKSDDVAVRCRCYGSGKVNIKQMEEDFERDSGAYILASLFNLSLLRSQKERRFFEEEQLQFWDQFHHIYKRNIAFVSEMWPAPEFSSAAFTKDNWQAHVATSIEDLKNEIKQLHKKVQYLFFQTIVLTAFIALAIFSYIHRS